MPIKFLLDANTSKALSRALARHAQEPLRSPVRLEGHRRSASGAGAGVGLHGHRLDPEEDPDQRWPALIGIDRGGAVLVRLDGFMAWRARTAVPDPRATLTAALRRILALSFAS